MVQNLNEISEIFSIFHDGRITKYAHHSNYSFLYIDCMYLAERFDKEFDYFILKIYEMENVELSVWPRDSDNPSYKIQKGETLFQYPLDIYDSEILDNKLIVRVGQNDNSGLDYVGGDLSFRCLGIEIYDPKLSEIKFEELVRICDKYWKYFSER